MNTPSEIEIDTYYKKSKQAILTKNVVYFLELRVLLVRDLSGDVVDVGTSGAAESIRVRSLLGNQHVSTRGAKRQHNRALRVRMET